MDSIDWNQVTQYLDELYTASEGLELIFPGRKFTLDGHLVGSIGEVVAAYMFELELNPASTQGYDAKTRDGIKVEIKFTQGSSVAIRHEPQHLLVLQRPKAGTVQVIYNGPGGLAWSAAGPLQKNGTRTLRVNRLKSLSADVPSELRIELVNEPPI